MELSRSLPENALHVWYTLAPTRSAASQLDRDLAERYRTLMAPEELARHDRFMQAKDRCQYLLGKVLVRTVLSHYLNQAPGTWLFTCNRFGKPVLANSSSEPAPRFNLAHTDGL